MKHICILYRAVLCAFVAGISCSCIHELEGDGVASYSVTASLKSHETKVSLSKEEGESLDLIAAWREGDQVRPIINNGRYIQLDKVTVRDITNGGGQASFMYDVDASVFIPSTGYELLCFTDASNATVHDDEIYINASLMRSVLSKFDAPMYAVASVAERNDIHLHFDHYMTYELLHVKNTTASEITFCLNDIRSSDGSVWYKTTGAINYRTRAFEINSGAALTPVTSSGSVVIPSGESETFISSYIPIGNNISNATLYAEVDGEATISSNTKSSDVELQTSHAYHMYAEWDGNELKFVNSFDDAYGSDGLVDLGLPSGILWATCNIGATTPEEVGNYYAWGEIEPKESYTWDNYAHRSPSEYTKYNDHTDNMHYLCPEDDIVHIMNGGNWRMPTIQEWEELKNNCKWETAQGGYVVTSNTNGKSIFLPFTGVRSGSDLVSPDKARYWSGFRDGNQDHNENKARALGEGGYGFNNRNRGDDRFLGMPIRGVYEKPEDYTAGDCVDLGLSVKWGSKNLGSESIDDAGEYYAWGSMHPTEVYSWETYEYWSNTITKYNSTDGLEYLTRGNDPVTEQYSSYNWRMPSRTELEELRTECEWTVKTLNGQRGYKITGKNGNSIFLPWSGYKNGEKHFALESTKYWSSYRGGNQDVNENKARALGEGKYGFNSRNSGDDRCFGMTIRPVYDEYDDPLTPGDLIDMGLSVKWSSKNIYAVTPEDTGDYYAWGETFSKEGEGYTWASYSLCTDGDPSQITKYNDTDRMMTLIGNDDIVHLAHGGNWRLPTVAEWNELKDNCTWTFKNRYGIYGYYIESNINHNIIFLPIGGFLDELQLKDGMRPKYWTKERHGGYDAYPQKARALNEGSYGYNGRSRGDDRCLGMLIRGVYEPTELSVTEGELIDLGLSVKWASHNMNASRPEQYGGYYAWGEITPKEEFTWDNYKYTLNGMPMSKYNDADEVMNLYREDDVVHHTLGGKWRMPTVAEWNELKENCTWETVLVDGVYGSRIESNINHNSIFLPWGGCISGTQKLDGMSPRYWTIERHGGLDAYQDKARALNEHHYGYNGRALGDDKCLGMPIRGVYDESVTVTPGATVDLGLSVSWASRNVGASDPSDFGGYYAWGELSTKSSYTWENYRFYEDDEGVTKMTKYNNEDGLGRLEPCDDAASSSGLRTPTMAEWEELFSNTEQKTVILNGTTGVLLTSKINNNSIFLPIMGHIVDKQRSKGGKTTYWSSDRISMDSALFPTKARALGEARYGYNYRSDGDDRCIGKPVRGVR